MLVKDSKVKSKPPNIVLPCFFFILLVILLLLRNLHILFFWYMYTCSFIGVEKYIFVWKVTSKVIDFISKNVIINIKFYFELLSNYFELYEKVK